jgi:hypothetical protein
MSEVIDFVSAVQVIPEMVHPLSKAWDQPKRDLIEISDEFARMSKDTLSCLMNYSHSQPSAIYDGKMWRSFDGEIWRLRWAGPHTDPGYHTIHSRKVTLDAL